MKLSLDYHQISSNTHLISSLLQSLEKGDLVVGVITQIMESGLVMTLLCLDEGKSRDIDNLRISVSDITVKFRNFRKPENFAVVYLKFKQRGQTLGYFFKRIQME